MKKFFFSLFSMFPLVTGYSQERNNYDTALSKLTAFYNTTRYDSIWQLLSPEMRNALPPEKTNDFFSQLKTTYGQIENFAYDKADGGIIIYKAMFEQGNLSIKLVLNKTNKIAALRIVPAVPDNLPKLERNTTTLRLPFNGMWTVAWGGDTREMNHHADNRAQKNAFDISMTGADGNTYKSSGKSNEDYYAFGQAVIAPCDAVVVLSVDGIKDNTPGEPNPIYVPGNSIVLKTKNNEYLFFAHFKQNSITVKEGATVKQGQVLGLCGNSGNSTEPHLHFHIQNVENMNIATGAKCFFEKIIVNGTLKTDYSPLKGDKISNIE